MTLRISPNWCRLLFGLYISFGYSLPFLWGSSLIALDGSLAPGQMGRKFVNKSAYRPAQPAPNDVVLPVRMPQSRNVCQIKTNSNDGGGATCVIKYYDNGEVVFWCCCRSETGASFPHDICLYVLKPWAFSTTNSLCLRDCKSQSRVGKHKPRVIVMNIASVWLWISVVYIDFRYRFWFHLVSRFSVWDKIKFAAPQVTWNLRQFY